MSMSVSVSVVVMILVPSTSDEITQVLDDWHLGCPVGCCKKEGDGGEFGSGEGMTESFLLSWEFVG